MIRESFVFYRSFAEALRDLDEITRVHCYDAITKYALDGETTELSGIESAVFKLIKPQIDANNKRFENGLKGGAPKGNKNNSTGKNQYSDKRTTEGQPKDNQRTTKHQPNVNVNVNDNANVNDNVNDNVNVNVNENEKKSRAKTQAFYPPSLEEVKEYCFERNNRVDAQQFIDFYSSKGWMIGKSKMKDWRAAVRTWERRDNERIVPIRDNKSEVDEYFRRELGI